MSRLLLIGFLAALVIVSGCVKNQDGGSQLKASDVFQSSMEASKKIDTIEMEYLLSMNGVEAKGKDFIKGEKMVSTVEIPTGNITTKVKAYIFGSDLYSCAESPQPVNWTCSKQQLGVSVDKNNQIKVMKQMHKNGAIIFGKVVEEKIVNSFKCKKISWSVDIKKLAKEERYFILASSGLSSLPNVEEMANSINSFDVSQCTTEDGIEVSRDAVVGISENKISLKVEVLSYKLNQHIDDSIFILPDSQNK